MHCVGPDTLMAFQRPLVGKYESDQSDQKLFGYLLAYAGGERNTTNCGSSVSRRPACHRIIRRGHLEYRHGSPYQLGDLGVTGTQVLRPRRSGRNLRSRYRRRALPLAAYSLTTRYVMRLARALPLSLMAERRPIKYTPLRTSSVSVCHFAQLGHAKALGKVQTGLNDAHCPHRISQRARSPQYGTENIIPRTPYSSAVS